MKARYAIVGKEDEDDVAQRRSPRTTKAPELPYGNEYTTAVDIAADPVVPYMNRDELRRSVDRLREQMLAAAKEMEFIEAARLRDEIIKLEARIEQMK